MFPKKAVNFYTFCRCSKSVTFVHMKCVLHVFKIPFAPKLNTCRTQRWGVTRVIHPGPLKKPSNQS